MRGQLNAENTIRKQNYTLDGTLQCAHAHWRTWAGNPAISHPFPQCKDYRIPSSGSQLQYFNRSLAFFVFLFFFFPCSPSFFSMNYFYGRITLHRSDLGEVDDEMTIPGVCTNASFPARVKQPLAVVSMWVRGQDRTCFIKWGRGQMTSWHRAGEAWLLAESLSQSWARKHNPLVYHKLEGKLCYRLKTLPLFQNKSVE